MEPRPRRLRARTPKLLWVLVLALLFGIVAAFLAAPVAPVSQPVSKPGSSAITLSEATTIVGIGLLILFGVWVLMRVLSGQGTAIRWVLQACVILLVLLLFALLTHYLTGPTSLTGGGTGPPPSGGTTPPNGTGFCAPGNCTNGSFPAPGPLPPVTTDWTVVAVAGALVATVLGALIVFPWLLRRGDGEGEGTPVSVDQARQAVDEALAGLEASANPRDVIFALYIRWMRLLEPRLGDLATRTPREIERAAVERFHLGEGNAQALTPMFEIARYSTHPLDTGTVRAFHNRLAAVRDELSRAAPTLTTSNVGSTGGMAAESGAAK